MKGNSNKAYNTFKINDPNISRCFKRGFSPLGDTIYIDQYIFECDETESIIMVPEVELKSEELIEQIIDLFKDYAMKNGDLPGHVLQGMSTWIFAWALEMSWAWSINKLNKVNLVQDMSSFIVPMSKFSFIPNEWVEDVINSFMEWSYNNPGYTNNYNIDIYDPLRDGYMAIIRLVVTRVVPVFTNEIK